MADIAGREGQLHPGRGSGVGRGRLLEPQVRAAAVGRRDGDLNFRDQFAVGQAVGVGIRDEIPDADLAASLHFPADDFRIQEMQQRGPVTARVGDADRPADGAQGSYLGIGNIGGAVLDNGDVRSGCAGGDTGMGHQGADAIAAFLLADVGQLREASDVHQVGRFIHAHFKNRYQ